MLIVLVGPIALVHSLRRSNAQSDSIQISRGLQLVSCAQVDMNAQIPRPHPFLAPREHMRSMVHHSASSAIQGSTVEADPIFAFLALLAIPAQTHP